MLIAHLGLFLVDNVHIVSILPQSKAFKCHVYIAPSKWGRSYEYSSSYLRVTRLIRQFGDVPSFPYSPDSQDSLGALTIEDRGSQPLLAQPAFLQQSPH